MDRELRRCPGCDEANRPEARFCDHCGTPKGFPAVLTDLTNSIRYGDIAVSNGGFIQLLEVKTSESGSARARRQEQAIKKVQNYLVTDEVEGLYGVPHMQRRSPSVPETDHAGVFNEMIGVSKEVGCCIREPEPGLRYFVSRNSNEADLEELLDGMGRPVLLSLNEFKNDGAWRSYYPFTLSIREPADVFDFLNGAFFAAVLVDTEEIERISASRGFSAEYLADESEWIFRFTSEEGSARPALFQMSSHFFGRLGTEFLSLEWLIGSSVEYYDPSPAEPETSA